MTVALPLLAEVLKLDRRGVVPVILILDDQQKLGEAPDDDGVAAAQKILLEEADRLPSAVEGFAGEVRRLLRSSLELLHVKRALAARELTGFQARSLRLALEPRLC